MLSPKFLWQDSQLSMGLALTLIAIENWETKEGNDNAVQLSLENLTIATKK